MTDIKAESIQTELLSRLIEDLKINDLDESKRNEMVIKMTEVLLRRIFVETMDRLGSGGREEYAKMSEGEIEPGQIEAFFKEKIHDYDEMVEKIIEEFRGEIMKVNDIKN